MTRGAFIEFLLANDCEIVREDANSGYTVVRRCSNRKLISGVPKGARLPIAMRIGSICRICKTLGLTPPEHALAAQDKIEDLSRRFGPNSPDEN